VGIPVSNFVAAVISLGAFAGAHISEVVRGGISSIPKGQTDASMALGLTFWPRLNQGRSAPGGRAHLATPC